MYKKLLHFVIEKTLDKKLVSYKLQSTNFCVTK
jgi:hypothetical protein